MKVTLHIEDKCTQYVPVKQRWSSVKIIHVGVEVKHAICNYVPRVMFDEGNIAHTIKCI